MFTPKIGGAWYGYIVGSLLAGIVLLVVLMQLPQRARKYVLWTVTFLGGLFYALEFFLPTHEMLIEGNKADGNFLSPFVVPMTNVLPVISAFAVGLGVINLFQMHTKRVLKWNLDSINSVAFFVAMIAMTVGHLMAKSPHPSPFATSLYKVLFEGALQSLDATMFSIIAFYITSAAYRAFRIRSLEATLLLATAIIVMLGQITLGQLLTHALPEYLHVEVVRNWILTKVNAPATRAISVGLGIGSLAVGLRIWLGLERGSYFDN